MSQVCDDVEVEVFWADGREGAALLANRVGQALSAALRTCLMGTQGEDV
jgi:hypothetical protein